MRKYIIIAAYSLYLVIFLGLVLHTSAHPAIFGKYTKPYFALLAGLVVCFPIFLAMVMFVTKTLIIHQKKRTITLASIAKLGLFLLLVFLGLTPIEVYLRQKYAQYEQTNYNYTIDNFHPFLQFQPTFAQNLHINRFGFRGDDMQLQKPQNTYRIFLLGGSTVFGGGVAFEKTIAHRLQKLLQNRYFQRNIEVINAGVDGYTSEHSLIQYLFKIKDFSPDMLIMWHGINDWYYSCSPKEFAYTLYTFDYSHFLGADAQMVHEHFRPKAVIAFHSITYDKFIKFMQDNWYSDIKEMFLKQNPSPGIYEEKKNTYVMNSYPSLASYKRNIDSFINQTQNDHVALILGNQPYLYKNNLSDDEGKVLFFPKLHCSLNGRYPSLPSMIQAMDTFNATTQKEANAQHITFVDLEKALPKTLAYFTDDVHYTEKGNQRIAETLFETIVEKNFLTQ